MTPSKSRTLARIVHVLTVPDALMFLEGQVSFMTSLGFEVALVCSPGPALDAFGERHGIAVYPVRMERAIAPLVDLRSLRDLRAQLRALAPDIAHSHMPKGGLLGTIAARLARVPVNVYHMRGLRYATAVGRQRFLLKNAERVTCATADQVLCVSHTVRQMAIDDGVVAPDKIRVLGAGSGNGVDSEGRFNPDVVGREARGVAREEMGIAPDALVLGFVGRLVHDKGIGDLAAAWVDLRAQFPALHLVLVGPFEAEDAVSPATRRVLETDARVHLLGERSDVANLYAAMDVVILPSHREGLPNVLLEAGAMGLPSVATRIPGCTDVIVDGETGMLVPPRDPARIVDAVARYMRDPALRADHGAAARARISRVFSREPLWRELAALYASLLAARGR